MTKENAAAWKAGLLERGFSPSTVNVMLAALNGFLSFAGGAYPIK